MNAETNELLRRLEQATSVTPVDRNALDEETVVLRENWLALGKLLKAAEGKLEQSVQVEIVELRRSAVAPKRSWLLTLGCVGTALAAFGLWFVFRNIPSHDGAPPMVNRLPADGGTRSGVVRSVVPRPANMNTIELAWEDDWDSGLAQASLALQQFHGEGRTRDSSWSRLQGEFQELARDFESGSL